MIQDVQVVPLVTREDDRGYLTEIARCADDPEPHGIIHEFGQVYIVGDPQPGIIRAFHRHADMHDWYFCASGSMKVVLVDDRVDGIPEIETFVLSMRNPKLLTIPPGVWHGWMSLEPNTILISITSDPYDRENPDEERIPYDAFGDWWTVKAR